MPIRNPVIRGFHPDPSVCRVGRDFYLATSSFEYFPAVPLFHSRDLVNWRQIGHALNRRSQLDLSQTASSQGIFAPTLRHHRGRFYLVTTDVAGQGHLLVTAEDACGPWSDPKPVKVPPTQQGVGFDPSLFFDDDNSVYFTWTQYGTLLQSRLDVETGELLDEPHSLWPGAGWKHPEGPHLFRRNGWYYLTAAEGGTEFGHRQTIARARTAWGPFETGPRNPILCHSGIESAVQLTGHADFVDDGVGGTWAVFLAARVHGYPPVHHLGRETFLAPVAWSSDEWPCIGENARVSDSWPLPKLPPHTWPAENKRDDFDAPALAMTWTHLRAPSPGISRQERTSHLSLRGSAATLDETGDVTLILRRQQHLSCHVEALFDFAPERMGDEAGLTVRMNESHHYDLFVGRDALTTFVALRLRIGPALVIVAQTPVAQARLVLQIRASAEHYVFSARVGQTQIELGHAPSRYLATEVAGGFTGVFFGLYASGNGRPSVSRADVDWFDYEGN